MKRILLLLALVPLALAAKVPPGKPLSALLRDILSIGEIHPDSVYPYIQRIETARTAQTDKAARAVYTLALGRLYAVHQYTARYAGQEDYPQRALQCFADVLAQKDLLARTRAKDWVPVIQRERGERYFNGDMLNVAWRTMKQSLDKHMLDTATTLPRDTDLITYYRKQGNREAALLLALDALEEEQTTQEDWKEFARQHHDLPLCAEICLAASRQPNLKPWERYAWLESALTSHPKYEGIQAIENERRMLTDPYFQWEAPRTAYPGKTYTWYFRTRNLQSVAVGKAIYPLSNSAPYEEQLDSIRWTAPTQPGKHAFTFLPRPGVKVADKVKPLRQEVFVTALQMLYQTLPNKRAQVLVVDAESGQPRSDVTLNCYDPDHDSLTHTYTTDSKGRAIIPFPQVNKRTRPLRIRMSTPEEQGLDIHTLYEGRSWQRAGTVLRTQVRLYTDRAIYRPGQDVEVGGLIYHQQDWNAQVVPEATFTLILSDAEGKECARQEVRTDSMGVLAAHFSLPSDRRSGSWKVNIQGHAAFTYFRVEEYKRPTFEVTLADTAEHRGDSLFLRGRALRFDGTPLRDARVTGTATPSPYRWGYSPYPTLPLDTLQTDADGRFAYHLRRDTTTTGLNLQVNVLSPYGEQQPASRWYRTAPERTQPPVRPDSTFLVRCEADTFDAARPALIHLYSNQPDVYLYYTLAANGRVVLDTLFTLSRDSIRLEIPYQEAYGQGASATFCFVKGEQVYSQRVPLYLTKPDTGLRLRWDTFRNLLQSGQTEEWRLTLLRPDGTPARANLMATLYDASLERLAVQRWGLTVERGYDLSAALYRIVPRTQGAYPEDRFYMQKRKRGQELTFSSLNEELFSTASPYYGTRASRELRELMVTGAAPAMVRATKASAPKIRLRGTGNAAQAVAQESMDTEALADQETEAGSEATEEQAIALPLRENFHETAFFRPTLRTDAKGQVSIVFTLPESLTTWRFLGVAHTADLYTAGLKEDIVARKDLMAQLRLPRFLRPGDEAQLTATVTNCTEKPQTGRATLQIVDAQSEKVLKTFRLALTIPAQSDTVCTFPYTAGEGDLLVRWAVENAACSDGEQRLLPVLPATLALTHTRALTAFGPSTQETDLRTLFPEDATQRRITVEYTMHPEELARQALPALAVTKRQDVLSLASAYYAGRLGQALDVPMADSTSLYLQRLQALQRADGSFTWYPGMPGSPYLTREVGYLMARLQLLTGDCGAKETFQKAARHLLQELDVPKEPSAYLLRNLYVIQQASLTLNKNERSRVDSLVRLVKRLAPEALGLEAQALSAIVLQQQGEGRKAQRMVEAFTRRLVETPTGGTAIEFPQGPFSSVNRKLHIHVQLMEALQQVSPGSTLLPGMRRHLLQQKRTQEWATPVTSANAVFALLYQQPTYEPTPCRDLLTLTLTPKGTVNFTPANDSPGYLRDSLQVESGVRQVRLHKFSQGESWTNVYADFRQPFATAQAESTGLSVRSGYPEQAQRGDRLTATHRLTADRDYDYVTLRVPRPAALEPVHQRSGYGWQDGLAYYREVKDDCTLYHFFSIPRGTYRVTEDCYVERNGRYHTGVATIQCVYAQEYSGHSADQVLQIR